MPRVPNVTPIQEGTPGVPPWRRRLPHVADEARKYSAGTRAALFALGKGTCYFQGCKKTVVEEVEGQQQIAVVIAHIKGANEGSARYDPGMTDEERAAFNNLVLMCTPHHKLIDGPNREKYPAELLHEWKKGHEPGISSAAGEGITADNLESLLENFLAKIGPIRDIVTDLQAVLWIPGNTAMMPFDALGVMLKHNPNRRGDARGVVTIIRNSGGADVSVTEVTLMQVIEGSGAEVTLLGRNDYGFIQRLPHRLLNGESLNWLTKAETLSMCEAAVVATGNRVSELYAKVRLATGEEYATPRIPWSDMAVLFEEA
jgi:hypothetical protein